MSYKIPVSSLLAAVVTLGALTPSPGLAQKGPTADYINAVFYNNRLDLLRQSYDRWRGIVDNYHEGEQPTKFNKGFYGTVNDFNVGQDTEGETIAPMTLGYALGGDRVGVYFLASSTDVKNMFGDDRKSDGEFKAFSLGFNADLTYVTAQADVTFTEQDPILYGKIYVPLLETYVGASASKYETHTESNLKKIRSGGQYDWDRLNVGTSLIPSFNIGYQYLRLVRARHIPNISFAAHELMDPNDWDDLKGDLEIYFESRGKNGEDIVSGEDFEVRIILYRMFGKPVAESNATTGDTSRGIVLRWTGFLGLSLKSESDRFAETLNEGGIPYNGQHGLGGELGGGLRVLGFRQFGFKEDTYLKFSVFYNYSQYFERFPAMLGGVKFRVLY